MSNFAVSLPQLWIICRFAAFSAVCVTETLDRPACSPEAEECSDSAEKGRHIHTQKSTNTAAIIVRLRRGTFFVRFADVIFITSQFHYRFSILQPCNTVNRVRKTKPLAASFSLFKWQTRGTTQLPSILDDMSIVY